MQFYKHLTRYISFMKKRSIASLFIALVFISLAFTGIWLFFSSSDGNIILLHTLFGALFIVSALFHFSNNWQAFKRYITSKIGKLTLIISFGLLAFLISGYSPVTKLSNVYASFKAKQPRLLENETTQFYKMTSSPNLLLEVRAGKHFWFPQIVIWAEDMEGNFMETLFVTQSTAKGDFIGGRTKENFKTFDNKKKQSNFERRRVDALPYWSHTRGIKAYDGLYAPTTNNPLPDGISGATPDGSFILEGKYPTRKKFKILLEANVAFDDNKYYSSYDFPDDSLYHSGTGLLGQPSVVYEAKVVTEDLKKYYMMDYIGHTFPSGINGELYRNSEGLTTAKKIIDLALLKLSYPEIN